MNNDAPDEGGRAARAPAPCWAPVWLEEVEHQRDAEKLTINHCVLGKRSAGDALKESAFESDLAVLKNLKMAISK